MKSTKLELFKNYVFQEKDVYLGIYPIKEGSSIIEDLLGNSSSTNCIPLFKTGNGSAFAIKNIIEKPAHAEEICFVLIGSEGQRETLATNEDEFISLILYDVGLIYDIVFSINIYNENPKDYPDPKETYNKKYLQTIIEENIASYEKYNELLKWVESNLEIKPASNPTSIIIDAKKTYPFH